MPYIFYIIDSYDPKTGTYYEPPSKKKDYYGVAPDLMTAYIKQAELLYREILVCINRTGMSLITQQFMCGIHKDIPASCTVDDGLMAV